MGRVESVSMADCLCIPLSLKQLVAVAAVRLYRPPAVQVKLCLHVVFAVDSGSSPGKMAENQMCVSGSL